MVGRAGVIALLALLASPAALADPQALPASSARPADSTAPAASALVGPEARLAAVEERAAAAEERAAAAEERAQAAEDQAASALEAAADEGNRDLQLYGFADVGFRAVRLDGGSQYRNIIPEHPQFLFGNFNVYLDAQPSEAFRALMEIRYTLYPGGTPDPTTFRLSNTTIRDTNSPTGRNQVSWAGLVVERAQLEWRNDDAFGLMAGYFLTPYGIWNVDHGTPVLISSVLPDFFAREYFPTHSLGVQALGSFAVAADTDLGYRLYVTNGRSPVQGDVDAQKNVGARTLLTFHGQDSQVVLGASGFYGTYRELSYTPTSLRPLRLDSRVEVQYEEWGAAGDLSWDQGPARVRVEWVGNRINYARGRRVEGADGSFSPDEFRWGSYLVAGYRTELLGLEPFVHIEYGRRIEGAGDSYSITSGGANVHFDSAAQLKLQAARTNLYEQGRGIADGFLAFDARLVVVY